MPGALPHLPVSTEPGRSGRSAKYALQKASLRQSPLAPLCLPSLESLIDWAQHGSKEDLSRQYRNREVDFWDAADREKYPFTPPGIVDVSGLQAAADEALRAYQVKLRELESDKPLPVGMAMSLSGLAALARQAYLEVQGPGHQREVKVIELEASAGDPRTICVGTSFAFDLPEWAAEVVGRSSVESHAFGCFRVFRDTTHGSDGGRYWSMWCGICKPSAGQRGRQWRTRIKRRWIEHALELHARR